MPGELEINRENRKKRAELTMEYPTNARAQEEETREQENRRRYTCLKCKNPVKTPIGRTNHLRNSPECRQVPQKGKFENQCTGYNRTFGKRHILRGHMRYICMQPIGAAQEKENAYQDRADLELEPDEEQIEPGQNNTNRRKGNKRNKEQQDNNGYMTKPGQPRQQKGSRENNNGALRYEAETKTRNCTICERSLPAEDARRATSHAETHTKDGRNNRRSKNIKRRSAMPRKPKRPQTKDTKEIWTRTQRSSKPRGTTATRATSTTAADARTTATATKAAATTARKKKQQSQQQ